MARNEPDPEVVRYAVELVESGASLRDVAESAGVSYVTVGRWVKRYGKPGSKSRTRKPPRNDPPVAPSPPPGESPEPVDSLAVAREMQRSLIASAAEARAIGNLSASVRATKEAAALANTIARIEKGVREDSDTLHISRAELDVAFAAVRERAAAILGRPLLCEHCSRALSVSWGTGSESVPAPGSEG